MEKYHLNISDVSRNAENAGFQLDQSYVSKVLNKKSLIHQRQCSKRLRLA